LKIGKIDYLDAVTAAGWSGMVEGITVAGAGCTTGGRAVVFGMYKGPVWPQADRLAAAIRERANAGREFTFRITV
jgi:hypothetical protein